MLANVSSLEIASLHPYNMVVHNKFMLKHGARETQDCTGPLLWVLSRDPCMQSSNRCLSPHPCFARNGCISFEIQGSKVCSTIRPLTLGHCLNFFQRTHVCKAQTCTFHQRLVLPGMDASVSRSKGPKCARLSAPSLCATVSVSCRGHMYTKPQPVPFTRAWFCQERMHQF